MCFAAVIISNAIAGLIEPSFFINIINIKKLPFLPDIISSSSAAYNVYVESFMNSDVRFDAEALDFPIIMTFHSRYIWYGMTYNELKATLKRNKSLKVLPLVASSEQMILLGSIQRRELVTAIERQVGMDRRLAVKSARRREAELERKRRMKEQKIKVLQDELIKATLERGANGGLMKDSGTNSKLEGNVTSTGILDLRPT